MTDSKENKAEKADTSGEDKPRRRPLIEKKHIEEANALFQDLEKKWFEALAKLEELNKLYATEGKISGTMIAMHDRFVACVVAGKFIMTTRQQFEFELKHYDTIVPMTDKERATFLCSVANQT